MNIDHISKDAKMRNSMAQISNTIFRLAREPSKKL